jgi:NAD(P)H-hydrate epimerase
LPERVAELFEFVSAKVRVPKISIDVPSGINSDTGEAAPGSFRPDCTITLGTIKLGLMRQKTFDQCGDLHIAETGIPDKYFSDKSVIINGPEITRFIPHRRKSAHKGNYGKLLNIAGSETYIGAALLSTKSALKCGTGLVTLASPKNVILAAAGQIPEAVFIHLTADEEGFADDDSPTIISDTLKSCTSVLIGCGTGVTASTKRLVNFVLANTVSTVILDADGINSLAGNINILKDSDKSVIITPHPAEFSRITGLTIEEIQNNRIGYAKQYANEWGVTVVLKGANTVTASPDGRVCVNMTGNAGLAKGGSGDVLSGIIGGFSAQGVAPFEAALLGTFLHGLCADKLAKNYAMAGIMPSDIIEALPFVMKR